MNILEHYIQEVKSVKPYTEEWTKEFNKEFVSVCVVTNCYGCIEERETVVSVEDWDIARERGYFMW